MIERRKWMLSALPAPLVAGPAGVCWLVLGITAQGRNVDHMLDTAQIETVPNQLPVQKGLEKLWASFAPRCTFRLARSSDLAVADR